MITKTILLLPALVKRAKDGARVIKEGVHQVIQKVEGHILTELLNLTDFNVVGYCTEEIGGQGHLHLYCERTVDVAICPQCRQITEGIKERKRRCVRDVDIWNRHTYLHFESRRFECMGCAYRFTEQLNTVEWRRRETIRFEKAVYNDCLSRDKKAVAAHYYLSESTVRGIFSRWAKRKKHEKRQSTRNVSVLGIDEISLKKRHKQFAVVISDWERCCVLAVLPGRTHAHLKQWFDTLTSEEVAAVNVVSMDMYYTYRYFFERYFPHAHIVADRFHVMKLLNEKITTIRRALQRDATPDVKAILKGTRWLLLQHPETLNQKQNDHLQRALAAHPQLRTAYLLKEEFRLIFEQIDDRQKASRFLRAWVCKVQSFQNKHLLDFVGTLHNWWSEILAYFEKRITNGRVEGLNSAIRGIIWRARGFRNFENFMLQVLAEYG